MLASMVTQQPHHHVWLRCKRLAAHPQVPPPTLGRDLATLLEAGEAADVMFQVLD